MGFLSFFLYVLFLINCSQAFGKSSLQYDNYGILSTQLIIEALNTSDQDQDQLADLLVILLESDLSDEQKQRILSGLNHLDSELTDEELLAGLGAAIMRGLAVVGGLFSGGSEDYRDPDEYPSGTVVCEGGGVLIYNDDESTTQDHFEPVAPTQFDPDNCIIDCSGADNMYIVP